MVFLNFMSNYQKPPNHLPFVISCDYMILSHYSLFDNKRIVFSDFYRGKPLFLMWCSGKESATWEMIWLCMSRLEVDQFWNKHHHRFLTESQTMAWNENDSWLFFPWTTGVSRNSRRVFRLGWINHCNASFHGSTYTLQLGRLRIPNGSNVRCIQSVRWWNVKTYPVQNRTIDIMLTYIYLAGGSNHIVSWL
jgi:hypothetical protein